jgi:hypothetical protein
VCAVGDRHSSVTQIQEVEEVEVEEERGRTSDGIKPVRFGPYASSSIFVVVKSF